MTLICSKACIGEKRVVLKNKKRPGRNEAVAKWLNDWMSTPVINNSNTVWRITPPYHVALVAWLLLQLRIISLWHQHVKMACSILDYHWTLMEPTIQWEAHTNESWKMGWVSFKHHLLTTDKWKMYPQLFPAWTQLPLSEAHQLSIPTRANELRSAMQHDQENRSRWRKREGREREEDV